MKRCIVIGSRPVDVQLKDIIEEDDFVFCADGGYIQAEKQGIKPDIIVGDFDSSVQPKESTAKIIKLPCEKDDTDSYYIARMIVERGYTHSVFFGVTGGRFDHTIANIQMLKFLENNGVDATIIDKNTSICVIKNRKKILKKCSNSYFSVFSLDEKSIGVSEKGGKYYIENVELTNDYPIGVSNEFAEEQVEISVKKGTLLIVVAKKD